MPLIVVVALKLILSDAASPKVAAPLTVTFPLAIKLAKLEVPLTVVAPLVKVPVLVLPLTVIFPALFSPSALTEDAVNEPVLILL